MGRETSLRQRMVSGVVIYSLLLTLALLAYGYLVNERAEALVWESLLNTELDHFLERHRLDPGYRWNDSETLTLYGTLVGHEPPIEFRSLAVGVHEDVVVGGREFVILVRAIGGDHAVLALNISGMGSSRSGLNALVIGSAAAMVALLTFATAMGVGRLTRPLADLARRIVDLRPAVSGQRLVIAEGESAEIGVVTRAFNGYLGRMDQAVERERTFLNMASHELRTPVAVIRSSIELALSQHDISAMTQRCLQRVRQTAEGMDELLTLVLVLAKDPVRLLKHSEMTDLGALIPEIVNDHRPLTSGKALAFELGALPSVWIEAPPQIVRAAIGNLIRNAIENSDAGTIRVSLQLPARVVISDPGHGMTAVEISRVYSRHARESGLGRDGIGLELIGRLCEHLGWTLELTSGGGTGTTASLAFAR